MPFGRQMSPIATTSPPRGYTMAWRSPPSTSIASIWR
jgi:hypothetical protein